MSILLVVLVAVVAIVVIGALALNPLLQKKADAAIAVARANLGGRDQVTLIEPKAVGHGSDPEEAGGLRGQGVLAVSADALTFVTWAPQKSFTVPRSQITGVTTSAADARAMDKATVEVAFTTADGSAKVSFRLPEVARWLDALGFDWGPEGAPVFDEADA